MIKDEAMLTLLGSAVDGVFDGLHFGRSLWDLGFVLLRSLQSIRRWSDDTSAIYMWQRL
jgi:hypothetical protein